MSERDEERDELVEALERATKRVDALEAEMQALKGETLDVYGIAYSQLTAGIVDDHDRIMRATNELAEAARRLTGIAAPLKGCA